MRCLVLPFLTCVGALTVSIASGQQKSSESVAVISQLSGSALLTTADGERSRLERFDWLSEGSRVDLDAGATLTIAFVDGSRCRLEEETSATVTDADLEILKGACTPLESVPPMPQLEDVSSDSRPSDRAAAIRIRGRRIQSLYPRPPARVLANEATIWFDTIDEAKGYQIEIQDEQGAIVFEKETTTNELGVPRGVLEPGSRYYWVVKSISVLGPASSGEAAFTTLGADDAERREKLKSALEQRADAEALALLAAIDRRLGLFAEARWELEAALREAPEDDAIRRALEELNKQLSH